VTPLWEHNSESFLLEQARLDPPVTSVTSVSKDKVLFSYSGMTFMLPPGTPIQLFISEANRDHNIFENPRYFDPTRSTHNQILSWNGVHSQTS